MKWFANLRMKFNKNFVKSDPQQELVDLDKVKQLYLLERFNEALFYLDKAVISGFNSPVYELRAKCFQKLDFHYRAIDDLDKIIEDNPLEFSYYQIRAFSRNAIYDISGQIEDLHSCIYYYRKNDNIQGSVLEELETDLLSARNHIEKTKPDLATRSNSPYPAIKNLITESLGRIKKIRLATRIRQY